MNFPSANTHSVLERPPLRKPADHDPGLIRPYRRSAPEESHDVVWSEARGEFIDVAASGSARDAAPARAWCGPAPALAGHILVVDDDINVCTILTELLRGTGYRVSSAADGEAGWNAFCADRFDLLITDHAMPRLTGLDLLRRLRAGAHQVPVIFISGDIPWEEADLARLLAPGTTLEKPFEMSQLLAQVRHFLNLLPGAGRNHAIGRPPGRERHPSPLVTRISR